MAIDDAFQGPHQRLVFFADGIVIVSVGNIGPYAHAEKRSQ